MLARLVVDGSADARARAFEVLAGLGGPAVPPLSEFLRGEDAKRRGQAARALGRAGPEAKAAVPALASALKDKAPSVRLPAAWALGEMGAEGAAAAPALVGAPRDGSGALVLDPVGRLRDEHRAVLLSLGRMGPGAASELPDLLVYLLGVDHVVTDELRGAAAWALGQIRPEAIPLLLGALEASPDQVEAQLALALGGEGPDAEGAAPELAQAVRSAQTTNRAGLARSQLERIAFELECVAWHAGQLPENEAHPRSGDGGWRCPVCGGGTDPDGGR